MAKKENLLYIEKGIAKTTTIPPPPKTEQRSIPHSVNVPPPSKGGSSGKK